MRSAPGRVNLIGEHTDYAGGLVLPFAIGLRTTATAEANGRDVVRIRSREQPDEVVEVHLADIDDGRVEGWSAYVAGVVAVLRRRGHDVGGTDISVAGDVPPGAGLASSAALECAVAATLSDAFALELTDDEIAAVAHAAENDVVGVPCGVMDQLVSVHALAGHALLIDCATSQLEHIPFEPHAQGFDVLVVDTLVRHSLADGAYAERQRWFFEADDDSDVHRRATRHVQSENERVRAATEALRSADWQRLGQLLVASHESLRDNLDVSCPELELAVETLLRNGAIGARLTGAGFGGSVVGLVPYTQADAVVAALGDAFGRVGLARPVVRQVTSGAGLGAESTDSRPT
ncbi:MAG TPA: galactokinase family protein [Mycobacteriales bacterium]|nr:galactokinase family protein [Mycobacteriales bacterium]